MDNPMEATQLLDGDELRRRLREDSDETRLLDGLSAPEVNKPQALETPLPLLEGWRAEPFGFKELARLRRRDVEGLRLMRTLLPGDITRVRLGMEMAEALEAHSGVFHRVKWTGLGRAKRVGQRAHVGPGYWTWATLGSGEARCVVGLQRPVIDRWMAACDGEGGRQNVVSDHLGCAMARLCEVCQWPTFDWAGEPVMREDIEVIMAREEPPWMTMSFSIKCGDAVSRLQMWIPVNGLRHIAEAGREDVRQAEGWVQGWSALAVRHDVVAGEVACFGDEVQRLKAGDVLLLDEHGVDAEGLDDGGGLCRWWLSGQRCVEGRCRVEAGRWVLEVEGVSVASRYSPGNEEMTMGDRGQEVSELGASALEVAEGKIAVKIADIELPLRDLARLQKGQVIACEQRADAMVELMVGQAVVGRGELVTVEGRLGVRIMGMSRPHPG